MYTNINIMYMHHDYNLRNELNSEWQIIRGSSDMSWSYYKRTTKVV